MNTMAELAKSNRGWIDYAMTSYWYQKENGYPHKPVLSPEERYKLLLNENSKASCVA